MQVTREDLNPATVKLSIVCDAAEVKEGFEKAFKQLAKKVRLPGFRPGHAPRAMVEGLLSRDEWAETAVENIVRNTFHKAVEQQELRTDPTTSPSIQVKKVDQSANELEYDAKVPLPPHVELGDYKGLPAEQPPKDVTDEEVQFQIDEFRKRRSTREAVTDRGVDEGDVVVVNIKVDGEEEGKNFMIIAGQAFFPELDEAVKGMRVEEIKSLDLTFPENFQEKDWAGQTKHATVTINSLSAVKLPDVDDAFAQSLQTENVEELRTRVHESLLRAKEQMAREVVSAKLLDALMERSTVHVSDNMWETLADRRLQEVAQEQAQQGKSLEQYAQENGMTLDQYVNAWLDRARLEVQRALLIQQVFVKENMQLSNEDLNLELFAMANEFGVGPEEMFNTLKQNNALDELQFRSISRKVGDFLLANAELSDAAPVEAAPAEAAPVEAETAEEAPAEESAPAEA